MTARPRRTHARKTTDWRRVLFAAARESSVLQQESVLLISLSLADLLLTYKLLSQQSAGFFEANPIAHWIFTRWNIAGMTLFKFALIAGVIAIGEVVERHRPGWGRAVLIIGCIAAAFVVVQGAKLYMAHSGLAF